MKNEVDSLPGHSIMGSAVIDHWQKHQTIRIAVFNSFIYTTHVY